MRAIWTGAISFGLVNIPVKLYSGTESKSLDFDMLHEKDLSPIRYARICEAEEKEVPYDEIVKGVEHNHGEYVVLSDDDFEKANIKKRTTIDIFTFVNEAEIDTIYFEKPYFLEPDKSSKKHYALLRDALAKSKKIGIGSFVMRNREHLGALKPHKDGIILNQMRYAEEIRDIKNLNLPLQGAKPSEEEKDMALRLINYMTGEFKPKEYKDTYIEELEQIISKKSQGETIEAKEVAPKPTEEENLRKMLEKSLEQAR